MLFSEVPTLSWWPAIRLRCLLLFEIGVSAIDVHLISLIFTHTIRVKFLFCKHLCAAARDGKFGTHLSFSNWKVVKILLLYSKYHLNSTSLNEVSLLILDITCSRTWLHGGKLTHSNICRVTQKSCNDKIWKFDFLKYIIIQFYWNEIKTLLQYIAYFWNF